MRSLTARTLRLPQSLTRPSPEALFVGGLVVVGALLRLSQLRRPMSYDEAYTFDAYVMKSLGSIASTYRLPNNQILYSLLSHVVWRVVGTHVWTVRLVAFVSGCLQVPFAYLVGRDIYSRRAGIWCAGLVATSAPLVDYSADGRGYTLGILLILVLLWLGLRLLSGAPARIWVAFAACAALSLYTVPVMMTGIAIVVLWLAGVSVLRRPRDRRFLIGLGIASVAAGVLALLLYVPVLGQPGWSYVQPLSADWGHVRELAVGVWSNWNRAGPPVLDQIVAWSFVLSLVLHRWIARYALPLLVPAALVLMAIFLFGPIAPFWRSWLCLLPLYLIPAGAGLSWLATQAGRLLKAPAVTNAALAAAVVVVLGLTVLHAPESGAEEPPDTDNNIVGLIRGNLMPGETVALEKSLEVASQFYFLKAAYTPPTFSVQSVHPGLNRVLVFVYRHPGPVAAVRVLRDSGLRNPREVRVTRLRHLQFISAFRVSFRPAWPRSQGPISKSPS